MSDILYSFVEVKLTNEEDFLKVCETLTRIGVSARSENRLYQTCHILHKQGKYYIVHFKEMLALDGNTTNYSEEDQNRRNKIISLLEQWKLIVVVDKSKIQQQADISKIKVIPFSEKKKWILVPKYTIGKKR